jgi:hypothetical protein
MITRKRLIAGAAITVLLLVLGASVQKRDSSDDKQWEYLIVAGGNVTLSPTSGRKQKEFRAEAVAVQQNLDRLGEQGWELVAVGGPINEPAFYLKRPARKQ